MTEEEVRTFNGKICDTTFNIIDLNKSGREIETITKRGLIVTYDWTPKLASLISQKRHFMTLAYEDFIKMTEVSKSDSILFKVENDL